MKSLTIKNIYFYLISFITLLILLFNAQSVISTILQTYVFKTTPKYSWQPPSFPFVASTPYRASPMELGINKNEEVNQTEMLNALKNGNTLTAEQKQLVDQWLNDYQMWKNEQEDQQRAVINSLIANSTSLILFAPVFYFHFKKARES